jgi:hypothetical protein
VAIAAAAATTCGGETAVETLVGPDGLRCQTTLGGPSAPVPPGGGTVNISITAARDCTWTATSEASWMQLNSTSGQGNASLAATVGANDAGTSRSGAVVVNNQRVTITQQPRPCTYELRASPQNMRSEGGRGTIAIETPAGCAWTATSSAGWLRVLTPAGSGPGPVEFEADANSSGPRQAMVAIGDQRITITQDGVNQPGGGGGNTCSISLSASAVSAAAAGSTHTVAIAAPPACDWNASSQALWVTVTPGTGRGNGSLTITAARNGGSARSGAVTVNDQTLVVNQAAAPACTATIDSGSATVSAGGGERSVRVTTQDGCEWTASGGDPSWTQILTPRGTGTSDARYSVSAYNGTSPRSTTLTIAGHSHTVTQEATAQVCTYTLQPTSQDHPFGGGPGSFTVTTQPNCAWTASSNQGWAPTTSSGTGNGAVSYTVQANSGGARQATITVSGGGGSASHSVTQQAQPAATCSYTLQPTSQDHPFGGGPGSFTVTTQPNCAWTASSNQGWAPTTSSGTGNGSVSYTVQANSGGARQATITVSGGGGSASHGVTQQPQPTPACTYSVSSGSQSFPANGGSGQFDVNTQPNCNWSAQAGDPSWVNISSGSGSGSQRVTYSVSTNSSTSSRSTSININAPGSNASHSITQAGQAPTCTYQVQPGSAQFTAAGGTGSFTVNTQSGCAWTFSGGANWITNVTQNGNTVSYTVQTNGTGAQRQASFTVSFSGGSQSHGVTQTP